MHAHTCASTLLSIMKDCCSSTFIQCLRKRNSSVSSTKVKHRSLASLVFLTVQPTDHSVWLSKGLSIYTEAIQTYPENTDLHYARGLLAADMGKVDLAEKDFRAVLKIKPDDTDTLNALGYTLADLTQRYQEAFQYISAAYKRDPDSPAILDSMGWVLYRLGRTQESLKFLRQAAKKLDDPEIAAHLGEVLWATGAREEARKTWKQAIERHPDSKKLRQTAQRFQ